MPKFKNSHGLTLIEVLIALAIISIALTAIIKATSHSIRSTTYLQNKMISTLIAQEVVNKVRLKLIKPVLNEPMDNQTIFGNETWYWRLTLKDTPNQKIKKIEINVDQKPIKDDQQLFHLESYLYENQEA